MIHSRSKPIRILHPLYDLNSGALTNWLMGVLRRLDRQRFQVDFLVHNLAPGYFDDEARALGARIIPCPHPSRLWTYLPRFKRILQEYGPYDVIHSSQGNYAFHMYIGWQVGVPVRITHIHTENLKWVSQKNIKNRLKHLYYKYFNPYWVTKYSTLVLTVSRESIEASLGKYLLYLNNWEILPCGIELDAFAHAVDSKVIRRELGIPETAFVIGHAGRLSWEKNHLFLVNVAAEVNRYEPNMRLLLLGEGPMRPGIEAAAARAGIADKIIFTGLRPDVPRLMLGAMDVFVFPSHFEGLGLALVEAQAAGLPCIASDNIVDSAIVVKPLVRRLPLSAPASLWAEAIRSIRENPNQEISRSRALSLMESSPFNINVSVKSLEQLYETIYRRMILQG